MILSVVILLLIGGIAYFHYIQGMLSATLSAICAAFAAVIAFGMHEWVVTSLLGGRAADYAHAMALVVLFAAIYTILRLAFDGFVPGNVQLPLYVERAGAAVMGIVAGLFSTGVLAVAAQLLPFGPPVAGAARYPLQGGRDVTFSVAGARAQDLRTYNELEDDVFDPSKQSGLLIPVDDLLVGLVGKLSADGSLAGAQPLYAVHPDFLTQAFGQRLGIQTGAKRVAYNAGGTTQVSLAGLFRLREAAQIQGELPQIKDRSLAPTIKLAGESEFLLVVRTRVDAGAADKDGKFRFSLGSVRLVVDGVNWYPIGTLEDGGVLFSSRLDDFLFKPGNKSMVDLVFRVNSAEVLKDPGALRSGQPELKPGAFVEVKRLGRFAVDTQPIAGAPPRSGEVGLMWKKDILDRKPGAPTLASDDSPLDVGRTTVSDQLFSAINVGRGDADAANLTITGGTASVRGGKLSAFNIDGSISAQRLAAGEYAIQALAAPAGRRIVQVAAVPKGADPWKWGDLGKFELEDSAGGKHKPVGAWAKVVVGTSNHFLGVFNADQGATDVPQIDGRPLDVYIAFAVPPGVTLTGLKFDGKLIASVNTPVQ
jgi:hypothetical protein